MQTHKFTVGQTVQFHQGYDRTKSNGDYVIIQLMPPDNSGNQYRAKNVADGHERVIRESQLD